MTQEIMDFVNGQVFAVWFLIGAALVFWMQAGFAMVEAGFTRAKNAGNIIMKNLMDFCIGTVTFITIGFSLLLGEDLLGFIGKPGFDVFSAYGSFDWSNLVFNLVFCATTATIVSGAMAERTKFLSYCVYSAVISGLIYPIEAHWIWGGGLHQYIRTISIFFHHTTNSANLSFNSVQTVYQFLSFFLCAGCRFFTASAYFFISHFISHHAFSFRSYPHRVFTLYTLMGYTSIELRKIVIRFQFRLQNCLSNATLMLT